MTDAMIHALFATNPRKRYVPGIGILVRLFTLLPAEITDAGFHRFAESVNGKGFPVPKSRKIVKG